MRTRDVTRCNLSPLSPLLLLFICIVIIMNVVVIMNIYYYNNNNHYNYYIMMKLHTLLDNLPLALYVLIMCNNANFLFTLIDSFW